MALSQGAGCLYSPKRQEGVFSETQVVPLHILRTSICRGNPMRSGLGICTNSRTAFRCMEFLEIQLPVMDILGNPYTARRRVIR
jgi:hypothetical protein